MTKAENLSHLCQMIRGNVYHSRLRITAPDYGYLTRLNELAEQGTFATEETLEIMELDKAYAELIKTAVEVKMARDNLVENAKEKVA